MDWNKEYKLRTQIDEQCYKLVEKAKTEKKPHYLEIHSSLLSSDIPRGASNYEEPFAIVRAEATIVPATTIECNPPYVAGKRDHCPVSWRREKGIPDITNKELCETITGMRLLPI